MHLSNEHYVTAISTLWHFEPEQCSVNTQNCKANSPYEELAFNRLIERSEWRTFEKSDNSKYVSFFDFLLVDNGQMQITASTGDL